MTLLVVILLHKGKTLTHDVDTMAYTKLFSCLVACSASRDHKTFFTRDMKNGDCRIS